MIRKLLKESDYTDFDDAISILEELLDKYFAVNREYSLRMNKIPPEKKDKIRRSGFGYAKRETGIDVNSEEYYALKDVNDLIDRLENINKYWDSYLSYIKEESQG